MERKRRVWAAVDSAAANKERCLLAACRRTISRLGALQGSQPIAAHPSANVMSLLIAAVGMI